MKRLAVVVVMFVAVHAFAQDDPVVTARRLARSGNRAEALAILEQRLAVAPRDTDARTLYGTILSWNGDYQRARRELQLVLLQDPGNADAKAALEHVESWSRRPKAARNEVAIGGSIDDYRHSSSWREAELDIKHTMSFGPVSLRAARGDRFGLTDEQVELELYPRITPRSYAYLDAGYSPHARLYPRSRFGAEWFQGFGRGYEASLGYRRLNFANAADIATASLSKYHGDWLFTIRGYRVSSTTSAQLLVRRSLASADSYVGLRIGKGSTRDEIRSSSDLQALGSVDAAIEARVPIGARWSLQGRGGAGKQGGERHTTATLLLGFGF